MVGLSRLQRKLFRDLFAAKAQYSAVVIVIMLGVTIFIASYAAYQNLYSSYENSFQQLHMADYWISVNTISRKAATDINEIPGVTAQGRIIGQVVIDSGTASGQRIEGRVISLPSQGQPRVNEVYVTEGRYFTPGATREILLEKHFAEYYNLKPGDFLTLKLGEIMARFRIIGIVTSPEYLWVAKSAQEPFTSPRNFGVLFMPENEVETMFGMNGEVNEIDLLLSTKANSNLVFSQIRQILRRYNIGQLTSEDKPLDISSRKINILRGILTAHMTARKDQIGNKLLKLDLDGFREIAALFPALFLAMAALAIYILLNRLIESQRVQIGLMRALGYGKARIIGHYLGFSMVVGILGSFLGAGLGYTLAGALTREYAAELKIPFITVEPHWGIVLAGMAVGVVVPVAAALIPALSVLRMHPAEAMRPPVPVAGRRSLPEVLFPPLSRLPQIFKLPLRNVFRNLRRSFFMAAGVASAIILILVSMAFIDTMQNSLNIQFERIQKFDAQVIFKGPTSAETASYIDHLQGIQQAEAVLEWPYRIRDGDLVADTSIMGLPKKSSLYNLMTPSGSSIDVMDNGILLTQSLKKKLNAKIGDRLQLEPLTGTTGETEMTLRGFVDEPLGSQAFLSLKDTQSLLKMPGMSTSVLLRFNQEPSSRLLQRLDDIPQTASIEFTSETRQFVDQLMSFFWVFIGAMLAMGIALGLSIVFNGVTINVLERRREFAVMRAVGTGHARLGLILTLENLITGFLGIIVGLATGSYVADYFLSLFQSDIFNMSTLISPRTYLISALSALVILLISQIPALLQVYRVNLSAATKTWSE